MKKLINKITIFACLTGALLVVTSIKKNPAISKTSAPISWITLNTGFDDNLMLAKFVVPDRNQTISPEGELLRYDAHLAKMFELTEYECQDRQVERDWDGISWQYYGDNGKSDLGIINISCSLARDIAIAYGFSRKEITPVTYYGAEPVLINVPRLDIMAGKVPTWLNFAQNFKPETKAGIIDNS